MAKVKKSVKKAQRGFKKALKQVKCFNGDCGGIRLPSINIPKINIPSFKRKDKPDETPTPKRTPEKMPDLPKANIAKAIMPMNGPKKRKMEIDYSDPKVTEQKTPPSTNMTRPTVKGSPSSSSSASRVKKSSIPNRTATRPSSTTTPGSSTRTREPGRMIGVRFVEEKKYGGKVAKKSAPKKAKAGAKVVKSIKKSTKKK